MSNIDLDVTVSGDAIRVTDNGNDVSPEGHFDVTYSDTITLRFDGLTLKELRISGPMWPGVSHLTPPTTHELDDADHNRLVKVEFSGSPADTAVLTNLNDSRDWVYKFGFSAQDNATGSVYDWDPEVHEEKPGK